MCLENQHYVNNEPCKSPIDEDFIVILMKIKGRVESTSGAPMFKKQQFQNVPMVNMMLSTSFHTKRFDSTVYMQIINIAVSYFTTVSVLQIWCN